MDDQTEGRQKAIADFDGLRKRFEQRNPSAETLQINYEQNVTGTTAGLFCAIWAAKLLGLPLTEHFTTINYHNTDTGLYGFGGSDLALGILIACKLLFVRALFSRYVVRPGIKRLASKRQRKWRFEEMQAVAKLVLDMVTLGTMVWLGLYLARVPVLVGQGYREWAEVVWAGYPATGVTLLTKCIVVGIGAGRAVQLAIAFLESTGANWFNCLAMSYLFIGLVMCLPVLGLLPLCGLLVIAVDLPAFTQAVAGVVAVLSGRFEGKELLYSKLAIGLVVGCFLVSMMGIVPLLIYTIRWASPETVELEKNEGIVVWSKDAKKTLSWLLVGILLSLGSQLGLGLQLTGITYLPEAREATKARKNA
ncbi:hypothetical protein GGI25_001177 [Coemansia spiralis]|uniref:Uncharacterized protein n=2 Tax=Coemansia TaxID=4863 RepID=A0A9W8GB81_9FUNG|nr:hypothetical protein BX070DRAFT_250647 [Coemansia spiralis]KAJ1986868.1 hypothetical protein EDC05_006111 [Coemansia umbellata]KAJ2624688.1 hypothetical protein GGI26_001382 [Coemansia sp. RSA 1358]KAJ2679726.1 hypothetical protein GGI25_001177 [Coemansia spiralis]